MPKRQDRALIRDPVADQGDTGKAAHRRLLNQRILHRWIAQVVPLLQQVGPQHGLLRVRRSTALASGLGVVGLNHIDQRFPRHKRFRLSQEALAIGALLAVNCLVSPNPNCLAPMNTVHSCDYTPIHAQEGGVLQVSLIVNQKSVQDPNGFCSWTRI